MNVPSATNSKQQTANNKLFQKNHLSITLTATNADIESEKGNMSIISQSRLEFLSIRQLNSLHKALKTVLKNCPVIGKIQVCLDRNGTSNQIKASNAPNHSLGQLDPQKQYTSNKESSPGSATTCFDILETNTVQLEKQLPSFLDLQAFNCNQEIEHGIQPSTSMLVNSAVEQREYLTAGQLHHKQLLEFECLLKTLIQSFCLLIQNQNELNLCDFNLNESSNAFSLKNHQIN